MLDVVSRLAPDSLTSTEPEPNTSRLPCGSSWISVFNDASIATFHLLPRVWLHFFLEMVPDPLSFVDDTKGLAPFCLQNGA